MDFYNGVQTINDIIKSNETNIKFDMNNVNKTLIVAQVNKEIVASFLSKITSPLSRQFAKDSFQSLDDLLSAITTIDKVQDEKSDKKRGGVYNRLYKCFLEKQSSSEKQTKFIKDVIAFIKKHKINTLANFVYFFSNKLDNNESINVDDDILIVSSFATLLLLQKIKENSGSINFTTDFSSFTNPHFLKNIEIVLDEGNETEHGNIPQKQKEEMLFICQKLQRFNSLEDNIANKLLLLSLLQSHLNIPIALQLNNDVVKNRMDNASFSNNEKIASTGASDGTLDAIFLSPIGKISINKNDEPRLSSYKIEDVFNIRALSGKSILIVENRAVLLANGIQNFLELLKRNNLNFDVIVYRGNDYSAMKYFVNELNKNIKKHGDLSKKIDITLFCDFDASGLKIVATNIISNGDLSLYKNKKNGDITNNQIMLNNINLFALFPSLQNIETLKGITYKDKMGEQYEDECFIEGLLNLSCITPIKEYIIQRSIHELYIMQEKMVNIQHPLEKIRLN